MREMDRTTRSSRRKPVGLRARTPSRSPRIPGIAQRLGIHGLPPGAFGGICSRRQFETLATLADEQGVGGRVVNETFGGRIPLERTADLPGDIGQVAGRHRSMADLDVGDGPLALPHTVEPILQMLAGLPERRLVAPLSLLIVYVHGLEDLGRDLRRNARDLVAVDLELALLADEHAAA